MAGVLCAGPTSMADDMRRLREIEQLSRRTELELVGILRALDAGVRIGALQASDVAMELQSRGGVHP